MDISGKHIVVVGLGKSGEALARFLAARGASVTVSDRTPAQDLGEAPKRLAALPVRIELGGHDIASFVNADLIVLSPGVPHTIDPVRLAQAAGVTVIGEIEFAARFIKTPIVAVTGTNGKSTTTRLIGRMLSHSGFKVFVGGNIGTPLICYADTEPAADVVVAEISSFQTDTMIDFRPKVGVLLNITADHLDRYPDLWAYGLSKGRLFANQDPDDTAVVNAADSMAVSVSGAAHSRKCMFNAQGASSCGAWIEEDAVVVRMPETGEFRIPQTAIPLVGRHNLENISAAALATIAAGGTPEGILAALKGFAPDPHRLEYVTTIDGVAFYDDSKATNTDAVVRAIEAVDAPVVLIAGGRDKGGGYEALRESVKQSVKNLVVLGEAAENILAGLGDLVPTRHAGSMAEAVRMAADAAGPGDVVLLSPACSSFDMYDSYARRGEDFQKEVQSVKDKRP